MSRRGGQRYSGGWPGSTIPIGSAPFVIAASATPGQHPAELTYLAPVIAQLRGEKTTAWADFGAKLALGRVADREEPVRQVGLGFSGGRRSGNAAGRDRPGSRLAGGQRPAADALPGGAVGAGSARPDAGGARRRRDGGLPHAVEIVSTGTRRVGRGADVDRRRRGHRRRGQPAAATRQGRAAVLRFRQKASLLRVPATVDWVRNQVEAATRSRCRANFSEPRPSRSRRRCRPAELPVARIHGSVDGEVLDLEQERMRFQTGSARVVVFTPPRRCRCTPTNILPTAPIRRRPPALA